MTIGEIKLALAVIILCAFGIMSASWGDDWQFHARDTGKAVHHAGR